jgi:hypothetical protein
MHQEENYKIFLNVEENGAMYKEFKLKYTNLTVMFSFHKSPLFTFKGHNLFISSSISILFAPLDALCGELQNLLEAYKLGAM